MDNLMNIKITGTTRPYQGTGRKLGYPTANINTTSDLKEGVYFGYADFHEYRNHPTLIFIGAPLTLGETEKRIEAHLLDIVDKDYYDKQITLHVQYFHRHNKKFSSVQALQIAMKTDEASGRRWFARQKLVS